MAFSPDGSLLAAASDDETVRIWDLATGMTRANWKGHDDWIFAVAFSSDGTLLATAFNDGVTRVWGVGDGVARATFAHFSKDGYATWSAAGYKVDGDPDRNLWWAIKLCRFAPGELDPYVPGLRPLPMEAPVLLLSVG